MTSIDPWFLYQLKEIAAMETELVKLSADSLTEEIQQNADRLGIEVTARKPKELNQSPQLTKETLRQAKRLGSQTSGLRSPSRPACKRCAVCAKSWAFVRCTSWWTPAPRNLKATRRISIPRTKKKTKRRPPTKKKIMILGSGPNRIGQGIEFDYCCCHAAFALHDDGLRNHHGQLQS